MTDETVKPVTKKVAANYVANRLSEASTVRGIILTIAATAGLTFTAEQTNYLVWLVLVLVGLVGTFFPDAIKLKKKIVSPIAEEETTE